MLRSSFRSRLDQFIHAPRTELALTLLILISVALVVGEMALPSQSGKLHHLVITAGSWIIGIFRIELLIRFSLARHKQRFFRRYWLDLIAVLPYPAGFPLLHLLRLTRLFRAAIFLNRNLNFISPALASQLGIQIGFLAVILWVLLMGAVGLYLLEGRQNPSFTSLNKTLWWSIFTLVAGEPIGGEAETEGGRIITLVVILCGLTAFAVFTGIISAYMVQRLRTALEVKNLELDELRNHIIICGWNRSGPLLLEELQADPQLKHIPIVVVAEFKELPDRELKGINRSHLYFYRGDYTMLEVLENVGIYHASRAILLADATQPRSDQDRDARTVLASLTIEKLQPAIFTCAQLLDRKNNVQLRAAGVEDVIVADEITSHVIATTVRNQGALNVVAELLTVQVGNQIYKLPVPSPWQNCLFWDVSQRLKEEADAILVAIERPMQGRKETVVNPPNNSLVVAGDNLVMIARSLPDLSKVRR